MLDVVFAQVRGIAKGWSSEVDRLRKISATNPIADTMAYLADELTSVVKQLERETEQLTTAQFAQLHKTTPQTVTAWVRAKKVPGTPGPNGTYMIPRSAEPPRSRARVKRGRAT